jgi:hypothetical protein
VTRTAVSSSNVKSVGYDPETRILQVEFGNGAVYDYEDVDQQHHDSLLRAASPGRYLNEHIKGSCDCTRTE